MAFWVDLYGFSTCILAPASVCSEGALPSSRDRPAWYHSARSSVPACLRGVSTLDPSPRTLGPSPRTLDPSQTLDPRPRRQRAGW
eukprot:3941703-Rhodomonas_salina.1